MALENRKKRYEFYIKNKDDKRAEVLALRYPDVKGVKEEKVVEKKETSKKFK